MEDLQQFHSLAVLARGRSAFFVCLVKRDVFVMKLQGHLRRRKLDPDQPMAFKNFFADLNAIPDFINAFIGRSAFIQR